MHGLRSGPGKHGLSFFVPLTKVDAEERMTYGYASTEAIDSEGESITIEALEGALPGYMKFANIREMHQLSAVGIATEAEIDSKGLYIGAKVVDENAWVKVKEGVYKGFSIGGRATKRKPGKPSVITGLELIEISLVDRPANPEALIEVWKAEGSMKTKTHEPAQVWDCKVDPLHVHTSKADAVKCMQKASGEPVDKSPKIDESTVGETGKEFRGVEDRDLALAEAQRLIDKANGNAPKPVEGETKVVEKAAESEVVEFADPGYQADEQPRLPLKSPALIRGALAFINKGVNASKYSAEQLSEIRDRIANAWKAQIDASGPPASDTGSTESQKALALTPLAKLGKSDTSRSVKKGIETVISALSLLKQVNNIHNSLVMEKDKEGDESDGATRWKTILDSMGALIQDLAKEEIGELLETGNDVDFRWGYSSYDVMWAQKALAPAVRTMGKGEFITMFDELLGDRTDAPNYILFSAFTEELAKANGRLSIQDWDERGMGTEWGSHSNQPNDSWEGKGEEGGETEKTQEEKDDEMAAAKAAEEAAEKASKKEAPKAGLRGEKDKDPAKPAESAKKSSELTAGVSGMATENPLMAIMVERVFKQQDDMMDLMRSVIANGGVSPSTSEGRDPPRPAPKGTLKTVAKEDDFEPAPVAGKKDGATGGDTSKAETPEDVLRSIHSTPRFIARG